MSKAVEGSYINLTDNLDTILNKLAKAPTDSGKGFGVPNSGPVANLLQLVSLFEGDEKKKYYEQEYLSLGIKYTELKHDLATAIYLALEPIQDKRKDLESKKNYVQSVVEEGARKARIIAGHTVFEVKEKMGFI